MDAKDHREQPSSRNNICRLEWIAWAIEAARRHKEDEHRRLEPTRSAAAFASRMR
jgi:hypothetical protein